MSSTSLREATPVTAAPEPEPTGYRWRWVILGIVLIAEIMDLLDSTVITIAAPTVRAELGAAPPPCSGGRPATRWPSASS